MKSTSHKHRIKVEIETLPKNWAKNIINKIIWGNEKPKFDFPLNKD